jgi:nicotinate-nucleotide adenylyltransferase
VNARLPGVRWNEVTALFGGTFDPPHLGHRSAVCGLFSEPGVCRVLVLPSPCPPHKPTVASAEDRIAMTRLAFGSSRILPLPGKVDIDLREVERAKAQPHRRTYTFDTLQEIRAEIPNLAFVVGTDQLRQLPKWHRFPEVLNLSHWIVLERKSEAGAGPTLAEWEASSLLRRDGNEWRTPGGTVLKAVPTPAPALSSTEVRETLTRQGKPADDTLLPEVSTYLMQRRIYGTKGVRS